MARPWDVTAIERAFTDAALDPSRWNTAMEVVASVTASTGAALFPKPDSPTVSLPFVPQSVSLEAAFYSYIRDGWVIHDERYRAWPIALKRGVATDLDFTTPEKIARDPYYQEFLAPHQLRWFAGVVVSAGEEQWALSVQRSIAQGPFSPEEQQLLAGLSSRLSSAAALARALSFSATNIVLEAFDLSGTAIVLLNRGGEVIKLNQQAQSLLGSGIQVNRRQLVAEQRSATDALNRALHRLIWSDDGTVLMPPVLLPREDRKPLWAHPTKLSTVTANVFGECKALVVLIDPEKRHVPPETTLKAVFGLSSAEARLAARLASGDTIDKVADQLQISKSTARNQLKSIFAKSGVHRQAEFVALVGSLLSPILGL